MPEDHRRAKKQSLTDRAKELVQDALEALEQLLAPPPQQGLVPIPIDRSRR
jgi:hypothetical protein